MPNAEPDGLFQLIVVSSSDPQLARLALALNGKHVDDPNIIYIKTTSLKAELIGHNRDDKLSVNLDGEEGGMFPVTFENLRERIEFYVG